MYDYTFFFVQLSVRENLTVVFKQLVFCDDNPLRKPAVKRLLRINRLHCRDAGDLFLFISGYSLSQTRVS